MWNQACCSVLPLFFLQHPYHAFSVNSSLTLCVTPAQPPPWRTTLFALSCWWKFCSPLCGSLLWGWMPDRIEEGGHNRTRGKKWNSFVSNWRQRNRDWREHRVGEQVEATAFSSARLRWESEKCTRENTQQVPKHFPSHQKNCTWQQLMAATAESCAEERFFCIWQVCVHPCVRCDKTEHNIRMLCIYTSTVILYSAWHSAACLCARIDSGGKSFTVQKRVIGNVFIKSDECGAVMMHERMGSSRSFLPMESVSITPSTAHLKRSDMMGTDTIENADQLW